ncbi:MAG: lysophospholipid acyltransferase family protein [Candidatus Omnitrophota bacterium]|nr:lysophospholipid acyltransferase family protein [Candidatus Omnitrophota bacterium]
MAKIRTRRYYLYYAAKILFCIIGFIPRRISVFLSDHLGRGAFKLLKKHREIAVSNLKDGFGCDDKECLRIAEDVFRNVAKNGADWIKFLSYSKEDIGRLVTEIEGIDNLDRAISEGKGVILLASHFGNWELLSAYLYSHGYTGAIIAKRIYFPKYDKLINRLRKRFGAKVVYRDESPKKLLRILKSGGMLGILADQDVDSVESIFVDFFGKPASTPVAPVKIGMVTGANLVPAFMLRKKDDTYKLIIEKAISLVPRDDKNSDIERYTQEWTAILEKYVKKYPDQWVWMHRRWKTCPQSVGE